MGSARFRPRVLVEALLREVIAKEKAQPVRVPAREALAHGMAGDAVRGNTKAATVLLDFGVKLHVPDRTGETHANDMPRPRAK